MYALKHGLIDLFYKIHAEMITPPGLPLYSNKVRVILDRSEIEKAKKNLIQSPSNRISKIMRNISKKNKLDFNVNTYLQGSSDNKQGKFLYFT